MKKAVIAYVPVLHDGYRKFLEKHADADEIFIFGDSLIKKYDHLAKEIRQLAPKLVQKSIESWGLVKRVSVLEESDLKNIKAEKVIMPDEDVCKDLAREAFPGQKIDFDTVFLRWDKHKSMEAKAINADQEVSVNDEDNEIIALLRKEAEKSSDWWRHIGAAIVHNGKIISLTHNHTVPAKHLHYSEGDPRNNFHKGVHVELSTILHAEAALIAKAAKDGVSLAGMSLYASTFPCPPCAKFIAYSGIAKLYYADGYGVLDGERVLRSQGVEIIHVSPKGK